MTNNTFVEAINKLNNTINQQEHALIQIAKFTQLCIMGDLNDIDAINEINKVLKENNITWLDPDLYGDNEFLFGEKEVTKTDNPFATLQFTEKAPQDFEPMQVGPGIAKVY